MFEVSKKMFKSAVKINIFIIIQLTIVLLTFIFMISSLYSRIEFYLPIKDILNQKASAITFGSEYIDKTQNKTFLLDYKTSPLKQELKNVKEVYTRYLPYVNNEEISLSVMSYDDSVINMYTPKLQKGKWLNNIGSYTGFDKIPAVIYQNDYSYNVGDTIEGVAKTYSNYDINVSFEIVGILNEDSKIFGRSNESLNNHLSFYESPSEIFQYEIENNEPLIMLVLPNKIVTDLNIVAYYGSVNSIVTYDENISDKDVILNTSELNMRYGSISENIWTINEKSFIYIKTQLYTLLPIVICIAIIAVISSICTSAIITKKNLKSYVIFFICGIKWRQCLIICLFNNLCTSIISSLISFGLAILISLCFNIDLTFNIYSLLSCSVIMLLFTFLSLILPYKILKSSSPCELLIRK
ncbi:MAG: hypothetical protein V8T22_05410 [Oscillospiraceae bacterium]